MINIYNLNLSTNRALCIILEKDTRIIAWESNPVQEQIEVYYNSSMSDPT
jgi:hypothetical protein